MHTDPSIPATQCRAIRLASVCELVGLSPASIWRLTKAGDFPRPFPLTNSATAWDFGEIVDWLEARKALRDER